MSNLEMFQSHRRRALAKPGKKMSEWAKRVSGELDYVGPGAAVTPLLVANVGNVPVREPEPVRIPAPDDRWPNIEVGSDGHFSFFQPPPKPRPEDVARDWLPQLEAQVFELEKAIALVRKRSDNCSDSIPMLVELHDTLREYTRAVRESM